MKTKGLIGITLALGLAGIANAALITVQNAGVESPGGNYPVTDNWGGSAKNALHASFGNRTGMEGLSFAFIQSPGGEFASQTLGDVFVADSTYLFTSLISDNGSPADIEYSIGYDDGGGFTLLNSAIYDQNGLTEWVRSEGVSYTTGAAGAELGQAIEIRIAAVDTANNGAWFDAVEVSVVPEPATLGLLGLAFGGLLMIRRRRK